MCPLINLILYILVFIYFKHYSFWYLCTIFWYTLWFLYVLELSILSYFPQGAKLLVELCKYAQYERVNSSEASSSFYILIFSVALVKHQLQFIHKP